MVHLQPWFSIFKICVEVGIVFYALFILITAAIYLLKKQPISQPTSFSHLPRVGIIYLCCNDLDRAALGSLTRVQYRGNLYLIVHDDTRAEGDRAEVDAAVENLKRKTKHEVLLLRRPSNDGGKSGAVNYVLQETAHLFDFFLLCDNDSFVESLSIEKALTYFNDPRIAIVQCRSTSISDANCSLVNRLLSLSIDTSHLFLATSSGLGWQPFIGHNAFLRTTAVLNANGFTPNLFHDDLDLSVRLNLKGQKIIYAPEIQLGEKHPPSYRSVRWRNYKWAYGCVQILKAHSLSIINSKRLTIAEKISFFLYNSFFVAQAIVLLYFGIAFVLAPFLFKSLPAAALTFIAGALLTLVLFAPLLSYVVKETNWRSGLPSVLLCGLIYGVPDFASARGVWDGLWNRKREWIPTNVRSGLEKDMSVLLAEALFCIVLFNAPLLTSSLTYYSPFSYLLGAKLLFDPTISLLYDDQHAFSELEMRFLKTSQAMIIILLVLTMVFFSTKY